ncbi:helix-turn-helix transcriptional regulator [Verrucosispora sp. CWR15]|uniref:Helix-turn-helix transcriptional regulator n=1 Tax=Verrucosispora sioxanthis TaxID=2499994 RepID=A0A6M1KYI9_9ACTN|nr:helix-turn-helix transcriptional regulator [Verrucosispora sioxanthis]NEE63979.1 helix-turn-helix transcriptional regulator [Verrucosispora sioxanthis]NGM13089.1 helix-turn-helix transcriptional regulator [Verrucosispora sioxanthis]
MRSGPQPCSPGTTPPAAAFRTPRRRCGGAGRPAGDGALTAREREIAGLATTGLTNKEIAARLHLSPRTIESHLNRVFAKLHVHSRTAMARRLTEAAAEHGPPA